MSRERDAEPIRFETGERRRVAAISNLRAQRELRRAGKGQLAAAKNAEAEPVVRHRREQLRRGDLQRLMTEAQSRADVRTEPDVVAHVIEQLIHGRGLELDR